MGEEEEQRRGIEGHLKQEVVMERWWREEVTNAGGKDEEGRKRIKNIG